MAMVRPQRKKAKKKKKKNPDMIDLGPRLSFSFHLFSIFQSNNLSFKVQAKAQGG